MVDYSRFDHIVDSDDEEGEERARLTRPAPQELLSTLPANTDLSGLHSQSHPPPPQLMTKKGKEGRLKFEYEGRTVYEWEQSLSEVNLFIELPPGVTKQQLNIVISPNHLLVGVKGQQPYLSEATGGPVIVDESMWMIVDGEININLQKMHKAEAWDCALRGAVDATVDVHTKEEIKKKLLLERFQEEHPGFDFSQAEFNGQVPSARDFMGGVKHF